MRLKLIMSKRGRERGREGKEREEWVRERERESRVLIAPAILLINNDTAAKDRSLVPHTDDYVHVDLDLLPSVCPW
jgi:hypothetical protein